MKSYIMRHWNGDLPLWKSYWVNGCLLAVVASWGFGLAIVYCTGYTWGVLIRAGVLSMPETAFMNKTFSLEYLVTIVPIIIWSFGGTWKAADKSTNKFGANLAKVAMVLGTLRLLATFVEALVS
jgi:hypothetical protein